MCGRVSPRPDLCKEELATFRFGDHKAHALETSQGAQHVAIEESKADLSIAGIHGDVKPLAVDAVEVADELRGQIFCDLKP